MPPPTPTVRRRVDQLENIAGRIVVVVFAIVMHRLTIAG